MQEIEITLLTSQEDIASQNIATQLRQLYTFERYEDERYSSLNHISRVDRYTIILSLPSEKNHSSTEIHVYLTLLEVDISLIRLDEYFSASQIHGELMIYLSRHQSQTGQPAVLCHTNGNWDEDNTFGGKPFQIARGSGLLLYYLFTSLKFQVEQNPKFLVPINQEVNHHGPTGFMQPSAFIELGSSEEHWANPLGGQIVAQSAIDGVVLLIKNHYDSGKWQKKEIKVCVGFGGSHYMPSFTPAISLGYGFAHTVPKYKILSLTPQMIQQIINQTLEPIDYWVLDWKGLKSAEKGFLESLLKPTKISLLKSHQIRQTNTSNT